LSDFKQACDFETEFNNCLKYQVLKKLCLMRLELLGMGTHTDIRGTKKVIGAFRDCGKAPKISLQKILKYAEIHQLNLRQIYKLIFSRFYKN